VGPSHGRGCRSTTFHTVALLFLEPSCGIMYMSTLASQLDCCQHGLPLLWHSSDVAMTNALPGPCMAGGGRDMVMCAGHEVLPRSCNGDSAINNGVAVNTPKASAS